MRQVCRPQPDAPGALPSQRRTASIREKKAKAGSAWHWNYVHFDPNGADKVDASIALDQKFFHGISQDLLPCVFNLEGFHFLGWNTEADGSGTQFADKATVSENLSDIDGGSVTLYAQWERAY